MRLLRLALRHPLLHFAAIGALLFAAHRAWRPAVDAPSGPPARQITITSERVRLLRDDFERRWGGAPSPAQLRTLIERTVEEEMLVREARALALDFRDDSVRRRLIEKARAVSRRADASADDLYRDAIALGLEDDVVIRRLLAEKMRLFLENEGGAAAIDDAELRAYLEQHRAQFVQPETWSFTHVFLSRGAHRERLAADAAATLVSLGAEAPSAAVAERSDPFPLGVELRARTHEQIMGRFGKGFADALTSLEPGKWSAPIASPYGLHLVWVHEHTRERLPPLDDVREALTLAVMQRRAAANLERGMARLRDLYEVRIEDAGLDVAGEPRLGGPSS